MWTIKNELRDRGQIVGSQRQAMGVGEMSENDQKVQISYEINKSGLSLWLGGKESTFQCMRCRFSPRVRKIPWRSKWQPPQISLPGKSHGQKTLVSYSSWGHKRVGYNSATNQQCHVQLGD